MSKLTPQILRHYCSDVELLRSHWSSISQQSTTILQSLLHQWVESQSLDWGFLSNQQQLRSKLFNQLHHHRHQLLHQLEASVTDLHHLYQQLHNKQQLLQSHWESDWNEELLIDFNKSSSVSLLIRSAAELTRMYRQELTLKSTILSQLKQQFASSSPSTDPLFSSDLLDEFLSCWLLEPFLVTARISEIDKIWKSELQKAGL